ncbi:MAG: futalosine hydrolase [Flaviaesturariibacter sp.]|nr:futalosine hydrolase [Flaviaesturariibacter sp.]
MQVKPLLTDICSMRILLCAATSFEIGPTTAFIRQEGLGDRVAVLVTGIGLLATTHALTREVLTHRPRMIIQAGIAGSFDDRAALGSTIAISAETVADLGVTEGGRFRTVQDLGLQPANDAPWQNGWLPNPHKDLLETANLPTARSITINEITTDAARIAFYKERFDPAVESMEGAALHYVGLQENIPFLQLRAISNSVGERDKSRWLMKESIASLNECLQKFIIQTLDI